MTEWKHDDSWNRPPVVRNRIAYRARQQARRNTIERYHRATHGYVIGIIVLAVLIIGATFGTAILLVKFAKVL